MLAAASFLAVILIACGQTFAMRGLLEKHLSWIDNGKQESAVFWTIYLGDYDCTLSRKFPGEDSAQVKATLNLTVYSSGYIEGTGYCDRGKLQCNPKFKIAGADGDRFLSFDEIASVTGEGHRAKLADGTDADLLIDIEGVTAPVKKLVLTKYNFVDTEGERTLKPDPRVKDVTISGFSFAKTEK